MAFNLNDACKLFYQQVLAKNPAQLRHITGITDIGTAWVFDYGDPDTGDCLDEPPYSIDRQGNISVFSLPNRDNFKLLEAGNPVKIPETYI